MAVCEVHGERITHPLGCTGCQKDNSKAKKAQKKSFNRFGFTQRKNSELSLKKDQAQAALRKIILEIYCKGKVFVNCWTCGKPKLVKGTSVVDTIHVGHFFPKNPYWGLAYELKNCGLQCFGCNVNTQGIIPAMRPKLVEIHGEQSIKELETKATKFMDEVHMKIRKSKPDELWLMAMIQDLKQQLKNIN